MSVNKNLFVFQKKFNNLDSVKKSKSIKKRHQKKISIKKIRKFSLKNDSKIRNACNRNYYVKFAKKSFTQIFVQKISRKIYVILKKKIE